MNSKLPIKSKMLNNWSCIVITCPTVSSVISTEKEINYLKKKGRIPDSLCVLTIEDPAKNLGSGAATLNALLVATEHLSVKQNYMVVSSDVLNRANILILHNGRNYMYSCTEKAFISLPLEYLPSNDIYKPYASGIISNLESALELIDELSSNCPYGVWVCSTDMMILREQESITANFVKLLTAAFGRSSYNTSQQKEFSVACTIKSNGFITNWENIADVVMFCIPSDVKYATGHGVVSIDELGYVSEIYYCGAEDQIKHLTQSDGKVPLVSGIVYLSVGVAESLLSLHVQAPLDSCTYLGLDSGADPIQVSLFFDLLVAMSSKISKESFIAGKCGKTYNLKAGMSKSYTKESVLARSLVWDELSRYKMSPKILSGCQHLYWSTNDSARSHMDNLLHIANSKVIHSVCEIKNDSAEGEPLIVNSHFKSSGSCKISPLSIVYDSNFEVQSLQIRENSFISGVSVIDPLLELNIPSDLVVINAFLKNPEYRFVLIFGVNESLLDQVDINRGTYCNRPWKQQLETLKVTEDDIWPSDMDCKQKTLMNAKLFVPNLSVEDSLLLFQCNDRNTSDVDVCQRFQTSVRYSMNDIMDNVDYTKIFDFRRSIYSKISADIVKRVLLNNEDLSLLPYFHAACAEDWHFKIMDVIDQVLQSDADSVIKTRALSNMADLLGAMAGSSGGLRSGPGSNPAWSDGFALLMEGKTSEGLNALQIERANWLDRPDHIMRAARHYERAAQILIQRSVNTVTQSLNINPAPLPEIGTYVVAECPARIDLQGGWTDTPPICYELGGSVVNIAVLIDGKKPIGAKACRTNEPSIILKIGLGDMCSEVTITHMKDILNYNQPNAQGALLKAALVCANIIDVHSNLSLPEQLLSKFGGGFFIQSWSLLPQGCGMGTSSILAGAVVGALWSVSGKAFDKIAVVHAVLYVEQLLTTGGGWQDQVSGIVGGVNRGYSEACLPLSVKVEAISLSPEITEKLNAHFLLIYTGKVRLAKNLLQNVIRNWYAREKTVVSCFKNLILHSHQMKEALINGDLPRVGDLMDKYWEQKKILAPGCEPLIVKIMMEQLKPICFGQLLVGAGGGGFMCILTKDPNAKDSVKDILSTVMGNKKMSLHFVTIDSTGLEITMN